MKYKSGEEFLNKIYPDLYKRHLVSNHTLKSDTPTEKIKKYLTRLENTHYKTYYNLSLLKKFYYKKFIIKTLPESYLKQQQRLAREEGYGYIFLNDDDIIELLNEIQHNQIKSLDKWIDYFMDSDCIYPTWFKVYAFEGMVRLGKYDKEKREFTKRTSKTVEPFLDINREVLANIYDVLESVINNKQLSSDEIEVLKNGESFKRLYTYFLKQISDKKVKLNTDGIWVKYNQGDNYEQLCQSLQGKNTGWCTAGSEIAKLQLKNGDFYIYYTKDENNLYTNPRIAIRMNGQDEIGEIRGIDTDQGIEPEMINVVSKKLDEFTDRDNYLRKVKDMKLLTEIENKVNKNIELTKDELIFLYELKGKIKSFNYYSDPRITELILNRDAKEDLSRIFGIDKKNIATQITDFNNNNIIIVYYRRIGECTTLNSIIDKYGSHAVSNLKYLINVEFGGLKNADYLNNVEVIFGSCDCRQLTDATGFTNLTTIYCSADFSGLKNANGFKNLRKVYGDCNLGYIKDAQGLEKLEYIEGNLWCSDLINSAGFKSLIEIGGSCYLWHLENSEGFKKLKKIGKNFECNKLKNLDDFTSLEIVNGNIWAPKLENEKCLKKIKRK